MSRRPAPEHDALIGQYSHENKRPREKEALHALRKVASLVKPIMRGRGWKVGTLAEFYPAQSNLLGLNINRGQKICLRLRYPGDANQFVPLEQVVDTMLHELCHNVIGPHNAEFNALWDQLRREYESLLSKGYTGEGFLSEGHKLGGRRVPLDEVRRQARAAAERRQALKKGSGQRLGGAGLRPGQDIRQVIVDAIERRNTVTSGCGSGKTDSQVVERDADKETQAGFKTKADEDTANDRAIAEALWDLIQEEERELQQNTKAPLGSNSTTQQSPASDVPPPVPRASKPTSTSSSRPVSRLVLEAEQKRRKKPKLANDNPTTTSKPEQAQPSTATPSSNEWTCPVCTCNNPWNYLCCDACGIERPGDITATVAVRSQQDSKPTSSIGTLGFWTCRRCSTAMEGQWWTCSACGLMKPSS